MRGLALALGLGFAPPLAALTLDIPGNPQLAHEETEEFASYALPVGPWREGSLPLRVTDGEVTRQVWRIAGSDIATLQIAMPLRDQLRAQGFTVLLDCETEICGGFDFRAGIEIVPPPAMHVDLGAFRFIAAETGSGDTVERVGILISRAAGRAFVQIIRVGPPTGEATLATAAPEPLGPAVPRAPVALPDDFGFTLESEGRVILSDLSFPSGSAQLGEGEFASLSALAAYLAANPGRRVALVGHTDATGALDINVTISKRRASSVLERLNSAFAVPRQQMVAEGMGWLAPMATNLTEAGREANRRVEVVLLSTE